MDKLQDPDYLRKEQYQDPTRLRARINLHRDYSTSPENWFKWVFRRLELPDEARILELGCGPGDLWLENLTQLPSSWEITLTDFSEGMLQKSHSRLKDHRPRFRLAAADARLIPFQEEVFNAVIANHMLYHIPDRSRGLQEIHRVLCPGGKLVAATIGNQHMQDLADLVARFDPAGAGGFQQARNPFTLENGPDQLRPLFENIQTFRQPDNLRVPKAEPLVKYVLSSFRLEVSESQRDEFQDFLEQELEKNGGVITIRKDNGLLTAEKG